MLSVRVSVCLCPAPEMSIRRLWSGEDGVCRRLDDDETRRSVRRAVRFLLSGSRLGLGLDSGCWTWTLWMSGADGTWGVCMSSLEVYGACRAHAELEHDCRRST